uniref:Toxin CptA n=1 Tax=Candidatus Kentrum sp. TUN TaxID=2126343 RepID=A0A450ZDA0_9GAMM|nr:MAG: hypothetical protein BECKTUN1418E_GA0071001_100347 [Candidatus Kentron sp. TUN]VFK51753.1 MAG: hypothetical protein BECKTUN1418F_GA0071002_100347 [Candidatus Kentron sp. TUN]
MELKYHEKTLLPKRKVILQPIRLSLHRSRYLALLLILAYGGAIVCLIATELAPPIKLIIGAAIIFNMFSDTCKYIFRCSRSSITTLLWTTEGVWQLSTRGGQILNGNLDPTWGLRPTVYVHPYLVVLNVNTGKGFAKPVVLIPDMVDDADAFRRLRIRLRFG